LPIINFLNVSNIEQRLRNSGEHADFITAPYRLLPVTESFGGHDEHKSDDARGVNLERPSFERSGGGRPNKLATQRHSNATGEDASGANIYS
jgi:hypothetical protein